MKPIELLNRLRTLDIQIRIDGDKLKVNAPPGTLTQALQDQLKRHKPALLELIRNTTTSTGTAGNTPIVPVSRDRDLPLSWAQQRLWLLEQITPGNAAYNIPAHMKLVGCLDTNALEKSLNDIIQRHESLRTVFSIAENKNEPVQTILPFSPTPLPIVDLEALSPEEQGQETTRLSSEEGSLPFDLSTGPLLRFKLLRQNSQTHVLLLTFHHIIFDGWSAGVFINELAQLYNSYCHGSPTTLNELSIQYADYAYWQRREFDDEAIKSQLEYWKEALSGELPTINLPLDTPRPARQTYNGASEVITIPQRTAEALRQLSRNHNATLFMTLLAAFNVLLYRHTGDDEILVGTPIANRNRTEIEGLIGFFLNTLVIRTRMPHSISFSELLGQVRGKTLEAYSHQDIPFEQLLQEISVQRDLSLSPLFQVMFVLQNAPFQPIELTELSIEPLGTDIGTSKFDLNFHVIETNDGLFSIMHYNTDLFQPWRIREWLNQFQLLLEQIVAAPDMAINTFDLVSRSARLVLPDPCVQLQKKTNLPTLHEPISAVAGQYPDNHAVEDASGYWTYDRLETESNRLAAYLSDHNIGCGDRVAIIGDRNGALVWAILGILKAGAVFSIFDPAYPPQRLYDQLSTLTPAGLVVTPTQLDLNDVLDSGKKELLNLKCRIHLPEIGMPACSELTSYPADTFESTYNSEDPAYVVFTSGTTGKPHAISGKHAPVSHFLQWYQDAYMIKAQDRFSMLSGLGHDPLLRDIFTPLWCGACICIPDNNDIFTPGNLAKWMKDREISFCHMTPAMVPLLCAIPPGTQNSISLPKLRHIVMGGDRLRYADVDKLTRIAPQAQCSNAYGTTETPQIMAFNPIAAATRKEINTTAADDSRILPIGKGIPEAQILILSDTKKLAGIGELGEIYIRTPYLTDGYLNNTALTCQNYITNPLSDIPGDIIYKTGDLGRYLPDGRVVFCGRTDGQIKLRAFRIETESIIEALLDIPTITQAVVSLKTAEDKDSYLAAFIVCSADTPLKSTEIREHLLSRLPEYMVPMAFITVDQIPLTLNGKVNYDALPDPEEHEILANKDLTPPRSPYEIMLLDIWREVLHLRNIGVHDNFFQLGGHSLMATQVVSRIRNIFNSELPLRSLFESPTIADLAEYLKALRSKTDLQGSALLERVDRNKPLPLSYSQERMWFLQQLIPEGTAYNMGGAYEVSGGFDPELFRKMLVQLSLRHESLRTTFEDIDGTPYQKISPDPNFIFNLINLQDGPYEEKRMLALDSAIAEFARPFTLSDPLMRVFVYAIPRDRFIVLTLMHHSITDVWSGGVLGHDFMALYSSHRQGTDPELPDKALDYADYASWQRKWLDGDILDAELAFWKHRLGDLSVLELPTDMPRPPVWSGKGARKVKLLPEELISKLKSFSAQISATPFMTMLTAFYLLLWRYTGQEDIAAGVPIANRTRRETENIVGTFVNTLVIRSDLSGDPSVIELIERVRSEALVAFEHQDLPFEKLVEELQPERDLSYAPLIQVLFNVQNAPAPDMENGEQKWEPLVVDRAAAQFDITLSVALEQGVLLVEYASDLFLAETIERMITHYLSILTSITDDENTSISDISLLSDSEKQIMLDSWNQTHAPYNLNIPVSRLFEQMVGSYPEKPAVYFQDSQLTYNQLNTRANQLANYLKSLDIDNNTVVGIYMDRSLEMLVALLGIMKSGAAYLPLDPAFPEDRIRFMIQDSATPLVLTQSHLEGSLGEHETKIVCIDTDRGEIERFPETNLAETPVAENLSYLIYTSGSTGLPKGVQIPNRALVNFLLTMQEAPGIDMNDVVLAETTLSFDIAGLELLLPLISGATIALVDKETGYDGVLMQQAIERYGATVLQATPASWRILLDSGWQGSSQLKALCGGEAMPQTLVAQLLDRCKELWNMYGPTETTIWSTVSRIDSVDDPILVGKPIANTTIYILDDKLRPVPIGVPGELHIGGDGLAWGYLNRPELTEEKFIPSPFSDDPEDRIYKTGDLARYRADGQIECLGRLDHQVKIRGFRIELGEIETRLSENPAVRKNVVIAREDSPGNIYLAAYIVPETGMEVTAQILQKHLQNFLPDYMVPAAFVTLDELPLTPNGKINRRALPVPEVSSQTNQTEFEAPRTPMEEMIAAIWSEVLDVDQIGVHDNFFNLGGHSLLATRVVAKLRASELALDVPVRNLFERPTVAELTEWIMLQMMAPEEESAIAALLDQVQGK